MVSRLTASRLMGRGVLSTLRRHRRELFWGWIAYQTIKGLLTTSLVWVPLYFFLRS